MDDAMVTARMARGKKEAGNEVLGSLGMSASQAINQLYDYLIAHGRMPSMDRDGPRQFTTSELADAFAFVDSIALLEPDDFDLLDPREAKRRRMVERGLATEEDLA